MRTLISVFAILALISCQSPVVIDPPGHQTAGAVTHVSASSLKAVYLAGTTTSSASVSGRAVVSSSGALLGGILPTGKPTTLDFLDADGVAATATVTQAMQLTGTYVMVQYQVGTDPSVVASLNTSTGRLASFDTPPDVWAAVYPMGASAYYEAGGAIIKTDLEVGTAEVLSTGASVYQSVDYGQPTQSMGTVAAWDSSAFVYVHPDGTAYALDTVTGNDFRAVAISANGFETDIGGGWGAYQFAQQTAGNTSPMSFVVDTNSGAAYWAIQNMEHDNNPLASNGAAETGYGFRVYPVTFSTSGVTLDTSQAPLAGIRVAALGELQTFQTGRLGYGLRSGSSMWSSGPRTVTLSFSGDVPVPGAYDTSAVPQVCPVDAQSTPTGRVNNFRYIGGQLYYGPASTQAIGIVTLGASVVAHELVAEVGSITAWTVVGGVLFWTDSTGSWQASVDTQAGTLGTVTAYPGGAVTGVTG